MNPLVMLGLPDCIAGHINSYLGGKMYWVARGALTRTNRLIDYAHSDFYHCTRTWCAWATWRATARDPSVRELCHPYAYTCPTRLRDIAWERACREFPRGCFVHKMTRIGTHDIAFWEVTEKGGRALCERARSLREIVHGKG